MKGTDNCALFLRLLDRLLNRQGDGRRKNIEEHAGHFPIGKEVYMCVCTCAHVRTYERWSGGCVCMHAWVLVSAGAQKSRGDGSSRAGITVSCEPLWMLEAEFGAFVVIMARKTNGF